MKKILLITTLLISTLAASAQKNTSQSYIEKFKDDAIKIMHETGIPASIVLGVAMHESGCGNSTIAQNLNNQFGVKGYNTVVYTKHNKKVRTSYKRYDSVFDSFQDFARIMTERKQFSHLADALTHYDYKGWAKGIQRAGYAGSRRWASQVLGIINRYNLNDLDENPANQTQLADATTKQQ
ncbi:glycoside hydrolase family 73 protein [Mucilaginibacter sp. P25]|uniref:Flagellum-specific peptidoglycan hydrolase FlgJ n=1 Tax=Mucilaginibacter gossypii TaxID=551996 RepID=A0A1G8K963_9SPHI|nr:MULTISPECIES: glucosaminidase domain-containing protein [Mucilaginibacter]NVM64649.1 flagellum-specific peptidoglycan hydrolase FlgJ [Mucilaginibacter sp. SG538B]SDI39964.1 Flagellum-specific peptidoglycan hydrolase FlgJ [Mucilaginibacter gossypii]